MSKLYHLKPEVIIAFLFYQTMLQQQLIEAQRQIIELQKRIDEMTPANPPDKEIFWHIHSGGMFSDEAAASDDVDVLQRFMDWNVSFAREHIKPYVNPKVYGECLNQMTRGLSERIASLQAQKPTTENLSGNLKVVTKKHKLSTKRQKQLPLLH